MVWNKGVVTSITMNIVLTHRILSVLIRLLLVAVIALLGRRLIYARNKNTPFECGFDPKDSARLPFSIRFFLLAVVFLIFDIEVAMLFPLIMGVKTRSVQGAYVAGFVFLIILIVGLIHEWEEGSLRWIL